MTRHSFIKKSTQSRTIISFFALFFTFLILLGLKSVFKTTPQGPLISPASSNSPYLYQTANAVFSAKIGSKETNSTFVSFTTKTGSNATFSLVGSESKSTEQIKNTIAYKEIRPNTDIVYSTLPNGIKEEIIISKPTTEANYIFNFNTTARPRKISESLYSPFFFDEENNYQFHLEKPFAVDAKGNRTEDISLSIRESKDQKNKYQLQLTVAPSWLTAKDRAYPITIDPTIVHDTSTEFAAGTLNRVFDTGSGSVPSLETFYQELHADEFTAALWHLNETADNTCTGGTNDVCDSSGNGFDGANTGSTINTTTQKLGAAARTFNGTTQYITIPITSGSALDIDANPITIEAWFNTDSVSVAQSIVGRGDVGANGYGIRVQSTGKINIGSHGGGNFDGNTTLVAGRWYHVAGVINGADTRIYLNGVLDGTGTVSVVTSTVNNVYIGADLVSSAVATFFDGSIDEVRISNAALSAEQIRLNALRRPYGVYTSEVLDLGGANSFVTTWNSLSWSEVGVTTGDGETLKDSTSLIAQWNFNETSGTTADNAEGTAARDGTLTSFASTGSQDAAPMSGWTANSKRWGAGALMFDGTNDYVDAGSNAGLHTAGDFSIESWFQTSDTVNTRTIASFGTTNDWLYFFGPSANILICKIYQANSGAGYLQANGASIVTDGQWHHTVCTVSGTTISLYIDGKLSASNSTVAGSRDVSSAGNFTIGKFTNTTNLFFLGVIDSTRLYSRALSAAEVMNNYNAGNIELQTRIGNTADANDGTWEAWRPVTSETVIDNLDNPLDIATPSATIYSGALIATSSSTIPLAEGTKSLKIQTGQITSLGNTIGLWHMEETTGTSAYIKDASINANNGTPTGTTSVNGIIGKARSFNGTSDYISLTGEGADLSSSNYTVSAWVNFSTTAGTQLIVDNRDSGTDGWLLYSSAGSAVCRYNAIDVIGATVFTTDVWHHVGCTSDGAILKLYVDGVLENSGAISGSISETTDAIIGSRSFTSFANFFSGNIDEVAVSNITRSADEIAEMYRLGRDHYFSKSISSTDLSGKTKLPFYVAADRPGTYLDYMIGENNFVNYEPDSNTRGLWHLDDNKTNLSLPVTSNLGLWVKADAITGLADGAAVSSWTDQSGNARHMAQATGSKQPTYETNELNGLPVVRFVAASAKQLTNSTNFAAPVTVIYVGRQNGGANARVLTTVTNNWLLGFWNGAYDKGYFEGWVTSSTAGSPASDTNWHLYSVVQTGALSSVYGNGALIASNGTGVAGPNGLAIGCWQVASECSNADVAEVLVYSTALSAADRQAVEGYLNTKYDLGLNLPNSSVADNSPDSNSLVGIGSTMVQGKIGKGRSFNGSSDFLFCTDAACGGTTKLDPSTGSWSAGAWIKSSKVPTQFILAKGTSTGQYAYQLALINGGSPIFDLLNTVNGIYMRASASARFNDNVWHHIVGTYDGTTISIYADGLLQATSTTKTGTQVTNSTSDFQVGARTDATANYWNGSIDEPFVTATALSADDIRQAFEYGSRTHSVTIDFGAKLDSGNLIADGSDLGFTIDATYYGLVNMGSNLYLGDKIVIRENVDGTEYIAQGTVNAVNLSTGATTVAAWDSGSTFPSGGFTVNATVFKWQREYFDITGSLSTQRDAITRLTYRITDGNEGRTIWLDDLQSAGSYLTTPDGSTITSSTGQRYFQYRSIFSSFDAAVSATISAVTTDYAINTSPAVPTLDVPIDTATNQILFPLLKTTTTDADADYIRYKIELCTNLAMTINCQTFDQTISQVGWSGQNTQSSTAYTSGTQATYTIQTTLLPNTTYFWRSYGIDPAGTNTFGSTQSPAHSFTTSAVPDTPTLDAPTEGATNQVLNTVLKTTSTDSNSDYLRYKIQICTDFIMTLNCQTFDQTISQVGWSGQDAQTSTAYASGTQATYTVQTALNPGTTYYWRSYAIDPAGTNTFSDTQIAPGSFTTIPAPNAPASCTITKAPDNSQIVVNWVDTSSVEDGFQIWKATDGGAPVYLSPDLAPNTVTYTDTAVLSNHLYAYQIRAFQYDGVNTLYSGFCTTATANLSTGSFMFEGLRLEGVRLN
jgi:hypothetical protein